MGRTFSRIVPGATRRFLPEAIRTPHAETFELRVLQITAVVGGALAILLGVAVLANSPVNAWILSGLALANKGAMNPDWSNNLKAAALEALAFGVLLLGSAVIVLPQRARVKELLQKRYVLAAAGSITLVALWLPVVLLGRSAEIAGERYWYLGDDAMISMRYARNLAQGIGLVWNPGERIEGYTNLLWTIYMALVHLLPIPDSKTSLIILLTNIALGLATIAVIILLVRALGGGTLITLAAVGFFVVSKDIQYWAVYGYETALLGFLFLLSVYRVLQEAGSDRPRLLTYILIASISLVRADAIVLSGMLYLFSLWLARNKRKVLLYSGVSLCLPLAAEAFRIYYYGDVLPNTAYLKTANWDGRYLAGAKYVADFAAHYFLALIFAVLAVIVTRKREWGGLLVFIFGYMVYVAYVGGDAFTNFRFFVPVIPLLAILAFLGVREFRAWRVQNVRLLVGALCFFTLPLIIPGYSTNLHPYAPDVGNIKIGLLLKKNTPPRTKVADFWAGNVFYFSERYAIDLLGKSDRYIAHLPANGLGQVPGHNKFDFDYSLGLLHPDYVVSHFKLPVTESQMQQEAVGDFAFYGQLYFNPVFQRHCYAQPIAVDTWRTIFVCDWSADASKSRQWRELATANNSSQVESDAVAAGTKSGARVNP